MTDVPVLAATAWRNNADLIADVARLGYLYPDQLILDPTYGRGVWWRTWRPARLEASDLDPDLSPTGQSVDFTNLPWASGVFDAVAFDPPYAAHGGRSTAKLPPSYHQHYGRQQDTTPAGVQQLIDQGLTEIARVIRPAGTVIVKCQDYIWSGALWEGTAHTRDHAIALGFTVTDRLEHVGRLRPQPGRTIVCPTCDGNEWIIGDDDRRHPCPDCEGRGRLASSQRHARRNLSTLFVLRAPKAAR